MESGSPETPILLRAIDDDPAILVGEPIPRPNPPHATG